MAPIASERTNLVERDISHGSREISGAAKVSLFSSKWGLLITCMGAAIGTGNIWRFPRIVANNSGEKGGLQFLLVWLPVLFLWSIPIIILEYAIGRFTRKAPPAAARDLLGIRSTWLGFGIVSIHFLVSSYYGVVVGWSVFYTVHSTFYPLPTTVEDSQVIWKAFAEESYWPLLTHFLVTLAAAIIVIKGVESIEPAMKVMIPLLLVLVIVALIWVLTLENAGSGLAFLFTPDWGLLGNPRLWIDAFTQNAWDTGAGFGTFLVFGINMADNMGPVKTGMTTASLNNVVSLICASMIFCTVFATFPGGGREDIVKLLKENGPANTGLTFVWMPILFSTMTGGRVASSLFFFGVFLAGFSSYVAGINSYVQALADFGVRRGLCVVIVTCALFLAGCPSALNLKFMANQDFIWSNGIIISGLIFTYVFWRYGSTNFRLNLINEAGDGSDWSLPLAWEWLVKYVIPLEGATLLVWWAVHTVRKRPAWYKMADESLMSALVAWIVLFSVLALFNLIFVWFQPRVSRWWAKIIATQDKCPCWSNKSSRDADIPLTVITQEDRPDSTIH